MSPTDLRVLADLTKNKHGVTFDNYPTGFRLAARIFTLREAGHKIVTMKDPLGNGFYKARYVLL
jgi:hypothetical protein